MTITIPAIREAVAMHYGLTPVVLAGADRSQHACQCRAVAYHLCVELTTASHADIGREFGNRDASTISGGLKRPLTDEYRQAFDAVLQGLDVGPIHAASVVQRWQFRSRRTPVAIPFFRRRYTA